MSKILNQKIEDFTDRVKKVLNDMDISEKEEKSILSLLQIELKNPTNDRDMISRYKNTLETDGGLDI